MYRIVTERTSASGGRETVLEENGQYYAYQGTEQQFITWLGNNSQKQSDVKPIYYMQTASQKPTPPTPVQSPKQESPLQPTQQNYNVNVTQSVSKPQEPIKTPQKQNWFTNVMEVINLKKSASNLDREIKVLGSEMKTSGSSISQSIPEGSSKIPLLNTYNPISVAQAIVKNPKASGEFAVSGVKSAILGAVYSPISFVTGTHLKENPIAGATEIAGQLGLTYLGGEALLAGAEATKIPLIIKTTKWVVNPVGEFSKASPIKFEAVNLKIPTEGLEEGRSVYKGIGLNVAGRGVPLVGYGDEGVLIGKKAVSLANADFSGGFVTESATGGAIMQKSIRGVVPVAEAEKFDLGLSIMQQTQKTKSKFIVDKFITETETSSPEGVKIVLKYAKKHGGEVYGSFAAQQQGVKRVGADIDVQFKLGEEDTIKIAEGIVKDYNKAGFIAKIGEESPTLVKTFDFNSGKWRHAVDIHSLGAEDIASLNSPALAKGGIYGLPFGQEPISIQKVKVMPLSEQGLRKGASVYTLRDVSGSEYAEFKFPENTELAFAPASHRIKDVGDFLATQEVLAKSKRIGSGKVLSQLEELKGYFPDVTPSKTVKVELYSPPEILPTKQSISLGYSFNKYKPSPMISKINKPSPQPSPVSYPKASSPVSYPKASSPVSYPSISILKSPSPVSYPKTSSPISPSSFSYPKISPSSPVSYPKVSSPVSYPKVSYPISYPSPSIPKSPSPYPRSPSPSSSPSKSPSPYAISYPSIKPSNKENLRFNLDLHFPTKKKTAFIKPLKEKKTNTYMPSLTAILFDIKTTKIPRIITGLETRGLYTGKKVRRI
jgi:hypothetical protein